ncbi:protein seele-like [Populus alba x Populus x berolinensis]|nr:protein seele-like [Populus alba x Populus x berolinensis]
MAESTAWLLTILVVLTFTVVSSIDDKCAACNAVAEEIENGLSNEKPRNHLDLRHRLDSKGQRKGKVIDYRVSELRVVELLDGLCDKMQDYTLQKVDSKRYEWVRVDSWDNLAISKYLIILPVLNNILVSCCGFCALANLSPVFMMFLHFLIQLDV